MDELHFPWPLLIFEALDSRREMSSDELERYRRLEKGFFGEKMLLDQLNSIDRSKVLPLFDFLFEIENQEVQIDCILLTSETIFLLEVKNYSGDYYIKNNKIYHLNTNLEIYNPITQLERTEFLFKKLLQEMRIKFSVRSYVIFVNPKFFLYQSPIQSRFIHYGQIDRFLSKATHHEGRLTSRVVKLKEELSKRKKDRSKYEVLPEYKLEDLRRGLFCKKCQSGLVRKGQLFLYCNRCKCKFHLYDMLLYSIAQFHLLFPEKKITTKQITDWCGNLFSRVFVSRFLKRHLRMKPNGSQTYYTFETEEEPIKLLMKKYNQN